MSHTPPLLLPRVLVKQACRALCILGALASAVDLSAQNTPLVSGGVGFFTNTNGGKTTYTPTLSPVLEAPVGKHLLFESKAYILESFFPKGGNQGYGTSHFTGVTYAQGDYLLSPHLTLVGGYYLIPFGTYNERLAPIWISNFQSAPLVTSLGLMGTGAGLGAQFRGNAIENKRVSIDYAAYFSGHSGNEQVVASRATGGRVDLYLPQQRLEIGVSYGRQLERSRTNTYGTHLWWQPQQLPIKIRSEYAHGAHAQGYWVEIDYRLSQFGGAESTVGRLEPVFRWQQTFRNSSDNTDGLPAANTQRTDFGLDYHLPHEVRINTSYARQFSSTRNVNIWETEIVYRFLFPAWKGK
ncbi:MAG: hypothetical protein ABI197_11020 [Granulicella sp.]